MSDVHIERDGVAPEGVRIGPDKKLSQHLPKVFKYIPPRLDDHFYQASIPMMATKYEGLHESCDWLGSVNEKSVPPKIEDFLEFLQYSRGLYEYCEIDFPLDSGLESDENMLEFFNSNGNDIKLSKLRLHSMLAFGKDYVFGSSTFLPPVGSQQQFEERFLRQNGVFNAIVGAFESSDKFSRSYASLNSRSGDPYGRFSVAGTDASDVLTSADIIKFENPDLNIDCHIEDATSTILNTSEENSAPNLEGSKRRRIDKQGTRKKFQALFKQVEEFAENVNRFIPNDSASLASRISLCALTTLIEELSYVSSSCESSVELTTLYPQLRLLTECMQVARKLHSKILDTIHQAYAWNAEIKIQAYRDKILDGEDSDRVLLFLESKYLERSKLMMSNLDDTNLCNKLVSGLVNECRSLPIKLEEEEVLMDILENTENWKNESESLLSSYDRSLDKKIVSKKKSHRITDPNSSIPTKLLSSVHSAFCMPIILLDGHSLLGILRLYTSYIKAHHEISDFLYFSAIVRNNREFGFINPLVTSPTQPSLPSDVTSSSNGEVEDKSYLKSRYDLASARLRVEKLKVDFAFVLPGLSDMEIIVETGEKYRSEVASLEATVPIRRVDSLLLEGEKFPFDFSKEISMLLHKRARARQWLDKVKSSISFGNTGVGIANSRSIRRTDVLQQVGNSEIEKPSYEALKVIASEGEFLLRNDDSCSGRQQVYISSFEKTQSRAQQKELTRVISLVEQAEEWQSKFKDTVSNVETDTEAAIIELKGLLADAEAMPIVMEEVAVLKAQLSLLEWSKRVRFMRYRCVDHLLSFKDCEKFMLELNEIYSSVDKTNESEVIFDVQLDEENYVRRSFNEGREWLVSAKDVLTVGGSVRKGASLTRVNELRDSSMLCSCVDLTLEIKPLCEAIASADIWKEENRSILSRLKISDDSSNPTSDPDLVSFTQLMRPYNLSSQIVIDFDELVKFRSLFDRCSTWSKQVKAIYASRQSKRKVSAEQNLSPPKPSIDDLEILLEKEKLLGVNFVEEHQRLIAYISSAKKLDAESVHFGSIFHKDLQDCVDLFRDSFSRKQIVFPFLEGLVEGDDKADGLVVLDKIILLETSLNEKLSEYDDFDIHVTGWEELKIFRAGFAWIDSVRTLLLFSDWENVAENDIYFRIRDILMLSRCGYTLDNFLSRVGDLQIELQSYLDVTTDFSKLVGVMKKSIVNLEKGNCKRVTRRKSDISTDGQGSDKYDTNDSLEERLRLSPVLDSSDSFIEPSGVSLVVDENNNDPSSILGTKRSRFSESPDVRMSSSKENSVWSFRPFQSITSLPGTLIKILDYWLVLLCLHYGRQLEAKAWLVEVEKIKSNTSRSEQVGKVDAESDECVLRSMLEQAVRRKIPRNYRSVIEDEFNKTKKWLALYNQVISGVSEQSKLKLIDVKELVSKSEKLVLKSRGEISFLLKTLHNYDDWQISFERSGASTGLCNSSCDLSNIIAEGKKLDIDVSNQLDILYSASKSYCICRLHYYGDMIGCDRCDDWFHLSCVGLTQAQIQNVEEYTCVKCLIGISVSSSFTRAKKVIDTWNDASSLSRRNELLRTKLLKRLTREENSLRKLQNDFKTCFPQSVVAFDDMGILDFDKLPDHSALSVEDQARIDKLKIYMNESKTKILQIKSEETSLNDLIAFVNGHAGEILEWMLSVKKLLVSSSSDDTDEGRPNLCPGGLPACMDRLRIKSEQLGFDRIEDVKSVVENYRWINWCFSCLHALRFPPSAQLLDLLVNTAKTISVADEKIVRFFSALLSRSVSWETKIKKLLTSKTLDCKVQEEILLEAYRVVPLYQEGNLIPFISQLKLLMKEALCSCCARLKAEGNHEKALSLLSYQTTVPKFEEKKPGPAKNQLKSEALLAGVVVPFPVQFSHSSGEDLSVKHNADISVDEEVVEAHADIAPTEVYNLFSRLLENQCKLSTQLGLVEANNLFIWPVQELVVLSSPLLPESEQRL